MEKKLTQAVVFDLDGTLLDTLQDLADAVNAALEKNGLPVRSVGDVRRFVGNGIANLIVRAMPGGEYPDTLSSIADDPERVALHHRLLQDFSEYYGIHCEDNTRPYDGIIPLLEMLKKKGLRMAVVSNKADFAVKKLIPSYFGDLIDVAAGEDEAHGIGKKPSPEMVLSALDQIGVTPEHAIYVGDSDVDIRTAKNAGMPCISVLWGFRSREFLLEHGAATLIEKPGELLAYL